MFFLLCCGCYPSFTVRRTCNYTDGGGHLYFWKIKFYFCIFVFIIILLFLYVMFHFGGFFWVCVDVWSNCILSCLHSVLLLITILSYLINCIKTHHINIAQTPVMTPVQLAKLIQYNLAPETAQEKWQKWSFVTVVSPREQKQ